ncbi:DUF1351 domain-containing protein, partial [Helcococcus kunzii]|uniref:DUF1351 domain-containing protein n=1 Tax=Helcococcus kunzii TaxID=40091 RepID=UPI0024AD2E6D
MTQELKTIEKLNLIPAKIETNIQEVAKSLDLVLEKYQDLVFTEDNEKECKSTIAELNKGKKKLNDFKIQIKKEASKDIARFEEEIKELSKKFDNVIDPIKSQYDKFEEDRKNEKTERIQIFINDYIREFELENEFAEELTIEESYLNKTATDKKIKEDLETRANTLRIKQDKYFADVETIKTKVELANAKNNTNLVPDTYISLLRYEEVEDISEKIFVDAEKTIVKEKVTSMNPEIFSTDEEKFVEKYEVTGTEKQLDELEEYMSSRGLAWKLI